MIKSMTGYGRGEFLENELTVTVETTIRRIGEETFNSRKDVS